jgi:hypothetical protein
VEVIEPRLEIPFLPHEQLPVVRRVLRGQFLSERQEVVAGDHLALRVLVRPRRQEHVPRRPPPAVR